MITKTNNSGRLFGRIFLLFIIITITFTACKNKEPLVSDKVLEINNFIYDYTTAYYLWEDKIPSGINVNDYAYPEVLFETMMYRTLDRWSFVTDDYQYVLDALDGSSKMPGYNVSFFRMASTGNIIAIVEYVYENTPAYSAGIQRGDVILKYNGEYLNDNNYTQVLYADQMTLGMGELIDGEVNDLNETVSLTSVFTTINPVLQYDVIDADGTKVGYLLYDQFIEDFLPDLTTAISYLQTEGVNELVLDLRFNPGGYVSTCQAFSSMLVPQTYENDIFSYFEWNEAITQYLLDEEGSDSENLVLRFSPTDTRLDLSRLFVLTSGKSASASEALINGLRPYMDVILIGDTTSGKYTGANFVYDPQANHDWGIYLVTSRFSNKNGETDFINGFAPDYYVEDDYTAALGTPDELLLSKALELITGVPAKTKKGMFPFYAKQPQFQKEKFFNKGIMVHR